MKIQGIAVSQRNAALCFLPKCLLNSINALPSCQSLSSASTLSLIRSKRSGALPKDGPVKPTQDDQLTVSPPSLVLSLLGGLWGRSRETRGEEFA